jgi:ERCC4-type nuclease
MSTDANQEQINFMQELPGVERKIKFDLFKNLNSSRLVLF